jgi:TP901 family phage tail tape measure protein
MADSTIRLLFLGDSSRAVRSVRNLESSFGGLGKAAHIAGAAVAVGLVGGLALATKAAVSFDRNLRNINTIAKLNETQLKRLGQQVLQLAKSTGQMPDTLAQALYEIVSSGFKAADGLKILNASAKAASAGLTDTTTATKAIVAVLNAYHLGAGKAAHVSDVLFQTVNRGVLSFEELASQIGDVLPVAAQLHVPLADIGGALATITLHGVNAAEASTQLKQTLVSILKPSDALAKQIHAMGFETGEAALKTLGLEGFMRRLTTASKGSAAAFADWFPNVRAMNGALGITGANIKVLHQNLEAMRHSQGAASAAFAEQGKSIAFQWQRAKASLTAAAIPVGQLLFPALKAGAEKVQEFATSVQTHMPEIRREFEDLSSVIRTLGTELGRAVTSPLGSSALLGGLAAFGAAKGIIGTRNAIASLKAGMGELGPAGIAAAAGIGLVTTAFLFLSREGGFAQKQIDAANNALRGLIGTSNMAADADRNLAQAKINVATTNDQLIAMEKVYADTVARSGRNSQEAKAALHGLQQARLNHKNAVDDERRAVQQATAANQANAAKSREAKQAVEQLGNKFREVTLASARLGQGKARVTEFAAAMAGVARQAAAAASKIDVADKTARKSASDLHAAASAAAALAITLGRIPTKKEISIFVRTFEVGKASHTIGGRVIGRAGGGFVPLVMGATAGTDSVPAMLTAGEIMLHPDLRSPASRAEPEPKRRKLDFLRRPSRQRRAPRPSRWPQAVLA